MERGISRQIDFPEARSPGGRRKSRGVRLRKEKVAPAKRTKHRSLFASLLAVPCHPPFLSSSRRPIIESGQRERENRCQPVEKAKKKERERERRRTGSAKFVACLITALHERYALAARMKHAHTYISTYALAQKSRDTFIFNIRSTCCRLSCTHT